MDNNTFGKKFAELRKQKYLSQEQLAFDLKISQSSISNYESGKSMPDMGTMQSIVDYFKVPITYFFPAEKAVIQPDENHGCNGYTTNSTCQL